MSTHKVTVNKRNCDHWHWSLNGGSESMVMSGDTADIDAPTGGTLTVKGVDANHSVIATDSYEIPNPDRISADWNISINAKEIEPGAMFPTLYRDYPGNDNGYVKIEVDGRTVTISMKRNMSEGAYNKADWSDGAYIPYDNDAKEEFMPDRITGMEVSSNFVGRVTPYGWGNRPYAPIPYATGQLNDGDKCTPLGGTWKDTAISNYYSMGPSPFYINWGDDSPVTYSHDYRNIAAGAFRGDSPATKQLGAYTDWGGVESNGTTYTQCSDPEHYTYGKCHTADSFSGPYRRWPQYYTSGTDAYIQAGGFQHGGGPGGSGISPPYPGQGVYLNQRFCCQSHPSRKMSEYPGTQLTSFQNCYTTSAYAEGAYPDTVARYSSPSLCAVSDAYILANCPTYSNNSNYDANKGFWDETHYNGPDLREWYHFYFEGLNPPGSRPATATNGQGKVGAGGHTMRAPVDDHKLHDAWDQYWDDNNPATPEQTYDNIHPRPELHDFHGNLMLDRNTGIYTATHTYDGVGEFRPTILYRDLGIAKRDYANRVDASFKHVVFLPRFRQSQSTGPHLYRGIQITD